MMRKVFTLFIWMMIGTGICAAQQDSAFTFQGKLNDGGTAANGNYEMAFRIYDDVNAGTQIGSTVTVNSVQVANGIFSVELDFGHTPFVTVSQRFLQIAIRPAGSSGSFTVLSPRQKITSSPFASQTFNADFAAVAAVATNVNCSACIQDTEIESGTIGFIINVRNWAGAVANSIPPSASYVFAGPQTSATITNTLGGEQVTGSATAVFGTSGATGNIRIHLCHRPSSGGTLTLFNGPPLEVSVTPNKSTFSVSSTAQLPAGTNSIGFCVQTFSGITLDNNGGVQGWVIAPK